MKYIPITFCILFIFCYPLYADNSLLEIKQQLDRIDRDLSDIQKELFTKKNINNSVNNSDNIKSSEITVFDMRLRDIENELKTINLNYENMVFEVDELKNSLEELSLMLNQNIINQNNNLNKIEEEKKTSDLEQKNILENENSLGTLNISSGDQSESQSVSEENELDEKENNLSSEALPEEQFQIAFDYLRIQKFEKAKSSLQTFIKGNSSHYLAGPAKYWLGEIHLLKKEYREAALVFAEGYQKYPESLKAPDTLYKLAEALIKIEKKNDACDTFKQFLLKYPNHKLTDKIQSKINDLQCN